MACKELGSNGKGGGQGKLNLVLKITMIKKNRREVRKSIMILPSANLVKVLR